MSNPNRSKVLVGFGAVAIVLVAAIVTWPPNFKNEEASGAIGVVQKHRAPQIAQKDVILGDEQTRTQQSILYSDYFQDAQKLQSISAQLASRDSQAANIARNSEELASALRNQYASHMMSALNSIELSAKAHNQAELAQQAEELSAKVKNAEELSAAAMQELNQKFANIAAASKTANNFEMANAELANALASHDEAAAASRIKAAEEQLSNVNFANVSLADQQEYFANIEAAASSLANLDLASQEMASRIKNAEALANRADTLAHAALANVEEQAASSIQMASAINQLKSQEAGIKASYAKLGTEELASALKSAEESFAQRCAQSFQAELAAMNEYAASKASYSKLSNSANMASMVASQELSSRLFSKLANVSEVANAAAALNHALSNQELANVLANEEQLASQASELASRKN